MRDDSLKLLLINGASGTGKTTLAGVLNERIQEATWIHPDGLMDTPGMTAEQILHESLQIARSLHPGASLIIDCQIRPGAIEDLARRHRLEFWVMVLLCCPREIRERRLIDRGWPSQHFDQIETWANLLREEAGSAGHTIFDTSSTSVDSMADAVEKELWNVCSQRARHP